MLGRIVRNLLNPMGRRRYARKLSFPILVGLVGTAAFAGTLYATTPNAPGREAIDRYVEARTTDQHYSGCNEVRAAGRSSIPSWDPSYRETMDGDEDGLACEPHF